jgi:hypothetical protein
MVKIFHIIVFLIQHALLWVSATASESILSGGESLAGKCANVKQN